MSDSGAEPARSLPAELEALANTSPLLGFGMPSTGGDGEVVGRAALVAAAERAATYAQHSRAAGTLRVYASDWRRFRAWCGEAGLEALPATPKTVALYLASQAEYLKVSTLRRHVSAVCFVHKRVGHPLDRRDPVLADVWAGICRQHGSPPQRKTALTVADLRAMIELLPVGLAGKRDKAMLLLGFAAAMRRSELVALRRDDIRFRPEGAIVTLRRSKSDQAGEGTIKGVPHGSNPVTCPVLALKEWIVAAGLDADDPIFMPVDRLGRLERRRLSDRAVARVVKRTVERWGRAQGLSKAAIEELVASVSGHSLRAGFATAAAAAQVPETEIAAQTGHRDRSSLSHYVRMGDLFKLGKTKGVGL